MPTFTARSSAGPFQIALRNVRPLVGRPGVLASVGMRVAGVRFGTWGRDAAKADFFVTFLDGLRGSLAYCDSISSACRGELLASPALEFARAMEEAPSGRPPSRTSLPVCRAEQARGRFTLICLEISHYFPEFPGADRVYLAADAAVCRVVAARCTWREDRCVHRERSVVEAWVSRAEMERLIAEITAFEPRRAGDAPTTGTYEGAE